MVLAEKQVAGQVKDYMAAEGWRLFRMQVALVNNGSGKRFTVGEKGQADLLFIKYQSDGRAAVVHVETKRTKGQAKIHQAEWHEKERRKGAVVLLANDFDQFKKELGEKFQWLKQ